MCEDGSHQAVDGHVIEYIAEFFGAWFLQRIRRFTACRRSRLINTSNQAS